MAELFCQGVRRENYSEICAETSFLRLLPQKQKTKIMSTRQDPR